LSPDGTMETSRRKPPERSSLGALRQTRADAAMAPGKKAKGGCSSQTREGRLPDEQERGLRQAPLPHRHGRPRGQSNKPTAPPCNSSSPPRTARRSAAEHAGPLSTRKTDGGGGVGLLEAVLVGGATACFTREAQPRRRQP
jgi:hypothetical protein